MNLNNKVIEVLDLEHGQKVKKFFEDNGVDTNKYDFSTTKKDDCLFIFYGLLNNRFDNYCLKDVKRNNLEIIKLPEEKEEIVELTLKDISEGKGVGVPSHLIRIKE